MHQENVQYSHSYIWDVMMQLLLGLTLLFLYSGFVLAEVCKWNGFSDRCNVERLRGVDCIEGFLGHRRANISCHCRLAAAQRGLSALHTASAGIFIWTPSILSPHRFFIFFGKLSNASEQQSICQNLVRRCTNDERLIEKTPNPWLDSWSWTVG